MRLEWHEVVTKHQVRGGLANQIRVNPLLAQIDKRVSIPFGKPARIFLFLQLFGRRSPSGDYVGVLVRCSHSSYFVPLMENEKIGRYREIRMNATNNPMMMSKTGSITATSAPRRRFTSSS